MNTEFVDTCQMLNCPIRSIDNVCDRCGHIAPDPSENGQRDRARDVAVALEQENADLRWRIAAALAVVELDVPETCYHAPTMEYYEDDPCPRCALRAFLTVPDVLTLDVIEARAAASNGAAA